MDRILVPLDGGPAASAALPHAVGLAARFHGELCLALVCDPQEPLSEVTRKRSDFLLIVGARLRAQTRLLCGNAVEEILREAEFTEPDLIVIGTRPENGTARATDQIMRRAPCPVMVVRQTGDPERQLQAAIYGHYPRYRRILVPLDGTSSAEQSLPAARRLVLEDGGEVMLVRVLDCPEGSHLDIEDSHRAYLEEKASQLRSDGCRVQTRYCHGAFGQRITELEQDLTILSSREHPMSGGSNISDVARAAICPVLVVRGKRQAGSESLVLRG